MSYAKQYRVYCNTEAKFVDRWMFAEPSTCPNDHRHSIDTAQTIILDTKLLATQSYYPGVADNGALEVNFPLTAFGALNVKEETPVVQCDFRNGLLDDTVLMENVGSGYVEESGNQAVIHSGAATNSNSKLTTRRYVRYASGQGAITLFTAIFTPPVAGSCQYIGCGNDSEGYFFGYDVNTKFGILRRSDTVDIWTYQENWNVDKMDGTGITNQILDTTKGNVFKIQFQWLGFGSISYLIEDSISGGFAEVHRIHYANENVFTSTQNPSFPVMAQVINTTNNTDITLRTTSLFSAVQGKRAFLGPTFGVDNIKVADRNDVIKNVLTIKSRSLFHGFTNYTPIHLRTVSVGSSGQRLASVYLIKNPVLSGTPSWTNVDTNLSAVEYDTTSDTLVGGHTLQVYVIQSNDSVAFDLTNLHIELTAGESIGIGVRLSGMGSNDITASLTWLEDR